jgi:hypothetical protein
MAYYLVSRMPPGETKAVEATSAMGAARISQIAALKSGHSNCRGTETYMVYECDRDGENCSDSPRHFTADELSHEYRH